MSVSQYIDHLIQKKKQQRRIKNGNTFSCKRTGDTNKNLKNSLVAFTKARYDRSFSNYFFSDFDEKFIKDYICSMKMEGQAGNKGGLQSKIKKFYGTFYYVGKDKLPITDLCVFDCVEHEKKGSDEQPQTYSYWCIQRMEKLDLSMFTKTEQQHIDFFLFRFYCGGIAPVDSAYLAENNFVKRGCNIFIAYERKKLPKWGYPPYSESVRKLVEKY